MRVHVCVLLLAAGCSGGTSVLVDVGLAAGAPTPAALSTSVYGLHGALRRDVALLPAVLPGRVVIEGVPTEPLRVVVRGAGADGSTVALGGAPVQPVAGRQVGVSVLLDGATADSDGDGVPDGLDDCPTVADPDQTRAGDAGPGDACAPSDGGADLAVAPPDAGPPSLCATSGLLFCDDFERAALAPNWIAVGDATAETVSVDTTRAYRGSHALHFHATTGDGTMQNLSAAHDNLLPLSPLWVRMFVYIPSEAPLGVANYLVVSQLQPSYGGFFTGVHYGAVAMQGSYLLPGGNAYAASTKTAVPRDRWVCVEWEVDTGPDAGSGDGLRVFIDGNEATDVRLPAQVTAPPLERLLLTYNATPNAGAPPYDIWMDEVAVDTHRIGCAN